MSLRSVEEQQTLVTTSAIAPRPVRVNIFEAQGLLSAEDIVSKWNVPSFDQAAIDGYAVRSVDIEDAGKIVGNVSEEETEQNDAKDRVVITLPVVGHVKPGDATPTRLSPRQAVKIDAGAPIPNLSDAVLPLKWTDGGMDRVRVGYAVGSGDYVRRAGNDIVMGDLILKAGALIGPEQIGLMAGAGVDKVLVHPRPRMSVIVVGEELIDADRQPGGVEVFDVVSYALAAAGRSAGADVKRVGIIPTSGDRLKEVIQSQLAKSEIIVISASLGGKVSEDIAHCLSDLGKIQESRIAMHPGAVQGFGILGTEEIPTFLLPNNPIAALIVFEIMIRPLIRIAMGKQQTMRRMVSARTLAPIESFVDRRGYIRGQLLREEDTGLYLVQPLVTNPSSHSQLLHNFSEANCLIVIDEKVTQVKTGDEVTVMFLAQNT